MFIPCGRSPCYQLETLSGHTGWPGTGFYGQTHALSSTIWRTQSSIVKGQGIV